METLAYSSPLIALDAVVLDTETTGLDARKARIVQIGAVRLGQGKLIAGARYDRLVNPGVSIPQSTTAVHGITDVMVAGAPTFAQIAAELEAFVGKSMLIGHTVSYDIGVLQREYQRAGRRWPGFRALDVRMLAALAAPTLADHGLDRLCEWLGIENARRHSAIGDAEATARVFLDLLPLLRQRNIRTLAEAEKASREQAENDARGSGGFSPTAIAGVESETRPLDRIDSFPYRHRVRDVMSAPAVCVPGATTAAEAMAILIDRRISSVLVDLPSGETGIVTERDILRAISSGAEGALVASLETIASKPLQTVAEDAFVYRAIGRIERFGFRHLGVRDAGGAVVGVVTTRNLLRHRATTAIALGDEIDDAKDAAALATAWAKLPMVVRSLMDEAVDPRDISAVISSEIRAMTRRAAELAEGQLAAQGHGAVPVPYAVLVLGSAGRGESQLAADQDNAIVYAVGEEGGANDRYFERLGSAISQILDAAGVPNCKGGVMASNRAWRMSVADWRATIDGWVRRQKPQDLLNVDIFFDAVGVHGDLGLADGIWNHAYDVGGSSVDFMKLLTELAREKGPAFTLLGNFRVDPKGRIDLKKAGLMPIFTCARVLAIKHDVRARSTADRLNGVVARGGGSLDLIGSIIGAQRTMLGIVLGQQLLDMEAGVPLSPTVLASRLGKAERAALKQALLAVDEVIGLVSEGRF